MDYKLQVYYNTNNLNCQLFFVIKNEVEGRHGTQCFCAMCTRDLFFATEIKYCASCVVIRTGGRKLSFAQQHGVVLD